MTNIIIICDKEEDFKFFSEQLKSRKLIKYFIRFEWCVTIATIHHREFDFYTS